MVKFMKFITLFTFISNLFGCFRIPLKPEILDGPGMVYIDSEHRTEYANTLPFDDIEGYPYWAVAFLGRGTVGEANRTYYIEKLFSGLPEESIDKIKHFDFDGDEWYLIIPRYYDENDIVRQSDENHEKYITFGEAFTVKCKSNIKIVYCCNGEHEFSPESDGDGKLICTEDIWDITDYVQ